MTERSTSVRKVWYVKHRRGWCARSDDKKGEYDDNISTMCGMFVVMTGGIEKRRPDCAECLRRAARTPKEPK